MDFSKHLNRGVVEHCKPRIMFFYFTYYHYYHVYVIIKIKNIENIIIHKLKVYKLIKKV